MVINPIVGVYIPIKTIPIKGEMTIPNIGSGSTLAHLSWKLLVESSFFILTGPNQSWSCSCCVWKGLPGRGGFRPIGGGRSASTSRSRGPITPLIGVISPQLHIYKAIYTGYDSIYNYIVGAHLVVSNMFLNFTRLAETMKNLMTYSFPGAFCFKQLALLVLQEVVLKIPFGPQKNPWKNEGS